MTERRLVDSSAWVEAMRPAGDAAIRQAVRGLVAGGGAVLCDWVLLELWNGARGDREKRWLRSLEADLDRVPTTPEVWELARRLARSCRERGLTMPASDLLIAACARHHRLPLLHRDVHFDRLEPVET